ncbi:hypothetical protein HanHA300_Chr08g0294021 [Helianthus annuus]|nr:hypothetical protein HanHA300_Chr08g0294021 [Helianthus annuus]KAJ0548476.1 hypothetical protein HanIR_Chr08g0384261 [Helianthus annuus]KAJ0554807.1 hypothetical protein HanHA89_Chr08g0312491 [Helianthus annuus]KAJ0720374.1 hypothetical protein HanLR1_Chr08g0292831 [Helianthus annuus]
MKFPLAKLINTDTTECAKLATARLPGQGVGVVTTIIFDECNKVSLVIPSHSSKWTT